MPVFKTFFKILKQKRLSLLLAIAIPLTTSFFFIGNLQRSETNAFNLTKNKVFIANQDKGNALAENLAQYVEKNVTIVPLETDQQSLSDALFFGQVDYVITIPAGFSEKIATGQKAKLQIQTRPDSFSQTLMNSFLNNYLSIFQNYQSLFPNKTTNEILTLTNQTINTKGTIIHDQSYAENTFNKQLARVFDLLAYGLFSFILQGIAYSSLTFNRKVLQLRNSCSPLSPRKMSRQLFLATLLFTVISLLLFASYLLYFADFKFTTHLLYFFVNTFAFLLTIVTFSVFICRMLTNADMLTGIHNIVILGGCFLGGVFVPIEYLPTIVTKIAAFTPTYWFVKANDLVGTTGQFTPTFYQNWGQVLLILGVFSLVFLLLNMVLRKNRGGLKKFSLN